MPRDSIALLAFNRGIVSPLALARVDLKRMALSAEVQNNWMPRALGSMILRPGLGYIGATASNAASRNINFIRSTSDQAVMEFTAALMRIWIDDALVTRVAVTSAVANGNFTVDLASWTDNDAAGATSAWVTGGYMGLTGNGTANAIRDQVVAVGANANLEHALRIVVQRGPVVLRVGTATTDDAYVNETELQTGTHSLAFTPTGDFNIRFMSSLKRQVLVDSCNVEAAGVMTLPTPYGASDLQNIRGGPPDSQSADVVFLACTGYTQRRIERRATRSWSVVQYLANDGPLRVENVGQITITPSALSGNITLTASAPLFRSTHAPSTNNAGAIFRITSEGQRVEATITGQNQFTSAIRITGVDSARVFTEIFTGISGTGSTITLQRSLVSDTGPWEDVGTGVVDTTATFDDGLDNQETWYRIGVKTGNYVAGTIATSLDYALGSTTGYVRITVYTSSTVVSAEVLSDLGGITATDNWAEGEWSDLRGWPSAVAFYESRLGWAGLDKEWLSITDAYDSHDEDYEGDAGPISRSIGSGPLQTINWMLPLQRLILGGDSAEHSCRSNAFDEPLTPTNNNIKLASSQGSAAVQPAHIDTKGMYVQAGGTRLFELAYNNETYDYDSVDMMMLCPELGEPSIVRIGVQRKPDTRIHCVRSDGTAAVLVYDKRENILCWVTVDTDGDVEDIYVKPATAGTNEDRVYYQVMREINGTEVRYHEKWALESECAGGTLNKQADAFVLFSGPPSSTIGGLTHLIGESVVVWADGKCLKTAAGAIATFTVNGSGQISATNDGVAYVAASAVAGLPYDAEFMSAKLGQTLTRMKRVDHLGVILLNTHAKGLKVGPTLTDSEMDYLPLTYKGANVDPDRVYTEYDDRGQEFPGTWDTDSRICMKAFAPRPANVTAAISDGEWYG